MSFQSTLYRDEIHVDDGTPDHVLEELFRVPEGFSRGLDLGLRSAFGGPDEYAYGDAATAFPDELLIPRGDWQGMIQEMEERKTRISDLVELAGLPCKDQNGTNFCWINAPVHCVEVMRVVQNQEMVILSPASAGGPIKGYRNVGGWGREGLVYLIENGCCPVDLWPANAIDRRYNTPENRKAALDFRPVEWWELRPRNLDQLMSCLLRRIPVAVGLNWWSHEVSYYDPVWINGQPGARMRNSWGMNWPAAGARGYSTLQGSRLLPDDAVAPRSVLAA